MSKKESVKQQDGEITTQSAFDGDLGPVEEDKMRQIIQEQDEIKDEKEKGKARQKRLEKIYGGVFFGRAQRGLFETEEGEIDSVSYHPYHVHMIFLLKCRNNPRKIS